MKWFGNNVCISYSRQESSNYAPALANELARRGIGVAIDFWEPVPGEAIPPDIFRMMRRAKFLVLLLGPSACQSENVKRELAEFHHSKQIGWWVRRTRVIGISFPDVLPDQRPQWPALAGIAWSTEHNDSRQLGKVSSEVIDRIVNTVGFLTRNRRLSAWAMVTIFLAFAAMGLIYSLGNQIEKRQKELVEAEERLVSADKALSSARMELDDSVKLIERKQEALIGVGEKLTRSRIELNGSIAATKLSEITRKEIVSIEVASRAMQQLGNRTEYGLSLAQRCSQTRNKNRTLFHILRHKTHLQNI